MILALGYLGMRRTRSFNDFFLGGGEIGPWMTAFTYAAAYFSAVLFIGFAGQIGWGFGLSGLWIAVGNALVGVLCRVGFSRVPDQEDVDRLRRSYDARVLREKVREPLPQVLLRPRRLRVLRSLLRRRVHGALVPLPFHVQHRLHGIARSDGRVHRRLHGDGRLPVDDADRRLLRKHHGRRCHRALRVSSYGTAAGWRKSKRVSRRSTPLSRRPSARRGGGSSSASSS